MTLTSPCPQCSSPQEYIYLDGDLLVCSVCTYEWSSHVEEVTENKDELIIKDANGNRLKNGDAIILIKDLKLKGRSNVLKKGTKVKDIILVEGDHEIDCKINNMAIMLKACFVKKHR